VHFLKEGVSVLEAYGAEIEKVLTRLSLFYQKKDHPLLRAKKTGDKALVILTGDKGLVGGLWHRVVTAFLKNRSEYQRIIIVGAKGKSYFDEESVPIAKLFAGFPDIPPIAEIERITDYIFGEFKKGTLAKVNILYPRFISLAQQQVDFIPFLPFTFGLAAEKQGSPGFPIFEPSKKRIFEDLLQKYIRVFFQKIVLEAKLSELSARTVAMEQASAKTEEFVQKATVNYLKEWRRFTTQKTLESFTALKIIGQKLTI
jgi:F-type H+-transporting ATPase subunit gamma